MRNSKRVLCDYCERPAELVTGAEVYPHRADLAALKFWRCLPCGAHVGCHKTGSGTVPLGRLANAELRAAKSAAHAAFDPLWKSGRMRRTQAYTWLANELGLTLDACHIGMFSLEQCRAAVVAAERINDA